MPDPSAPENPFRRIDALLSEVRERTSQYGERGTLAEVLGVAQARVSEYLADPPVRRPNAETTLALSEWLAAAKKRK